MTAVSIFNGDNVIKGEALTQFLIQLILVIVFCRVLAYLFKFLKQPPVIAEVVAGILLGPSALCQSKAFKDTVFPKASLSTFAVFANIGLIVFLFLVGLELDANLIRKNAKNSIIISLTAMVLPFGLGLAASVPIYNEMIPETVRFTSFLLFVAVALSITAFPVLARILAETRLLDDRVGNIALSSAAVDDITAWCLLALVVAIAKSTAQIHALYTFLTLAGFILFMFLAVRPVLAKIAERSRRQRGVGIHTIAFMLVIVFIAGWFTEIIGIDSIFGAFVTGIITPREHRFALRLNTDLGSLNSGTAWGLTVLIIVAAGVGKIGGATAAARFTKNTWRESFTVGVLMNTKGLVELIVLNLGLSAGVLTTEVFTMFVVMALVTTFCTTPVVHYIYLRHRDINTTPKENYDMVVYVHDQKSCLAYTSVVHKPNTAYVKAIFINEINDRPSSYFFHLSNKLKNDVPFFKDKSLKDMFSVIKKFGTSVGITVSAKNLNTVHLSHDVKLSAHGYISELIIFGFNTNAERAEFALAPQHSIRGSMTSLVEASADQIAGAQSPASHVIQSALANILAPIGVFVSKNHGTMSIQTVAFLFRGEEYENLAWQQILKMNNSIQVTIYTTDTQAPFINQDYNKEAYPNIQIIPSPSPAETLIEAQKTQPYDLVMIGGRRDPPFDDITNFVREIVGNVIIIFPVPHAATKKAPFDSAAEVV